MHLQHLTTTQLTRACDAADYLLGLGVRLDSVLKIKLDTFRADVTAAVEDREMAQRASDRLVQHRPVRDREGPDVG